MEHDDNPELDEALQAELVRRVLALEGREDTLRLNNLQLESTVESLTECTNVSPLEIRAMARELARSAAIDARVGAPSGKVASLSSSRTRWGVALMVIGLGMFPVFKLLSPKPAVSPSVTAGTMVAGGLAPVDDASFLTTAAGEGGAFHKKAMFGAAMVDISPVKIMVLEHYFFEGAFPAKLEDMGLETASMVSSHVRGVKIAENGAILADLAEAMGDDIQLKLVPKEVMGGAGIEWGCFSNLPSFVLSGTSCQQL